MKIYSPIHLSSRRNLTEQMNQESRTESHRRNPQVQLLSPYYYSTSEKRSFEQTSFLERMKESEVKKRLKLDSLRMEKRFEEYQQCP